MHGSFVTASSPTLLTDAPPGRHLAQFHRDAKALTESVHIYIEAGLRRGNSIVILATPEHSDGFLERLGASNFHPKALRSSGQLDVVDGGPLLDEFMRGEGRGVPEWGRFRAALAKRFEHVQPFGRGVRVYCGLAGMLWSDGNTAGAIRLEELWNALARLYTFSLYCGYVLNTQCEESFNGPLEDLGRQFSDILGTSEDEQFGAALDRASKEIFGISLSQMAGVKSDGGRRFPSGFRTMLWVKRNLPMSTGRLAEQARRYYQENRP